MIHARPLLAAAGVAAAVVLAGCALLLYVVFADKQQAAAVAGCGTPAGGTAAPAHAPVGSWTAEQTGNAAAIVNAGAALGLDAHGQAIGVMTAIGESRLRVIDYGDAAGPDSRGLFQQRAVGWGSYADRMNPAVSATNFFRALMAVSGWESMTPTAAAHATQHNADPYYYTPFWDQAVTLVGQLTGADTASLAGGGGVAGGCGPGPAVTAAPGAWVRPTIGTLTSGFSSRTNPVTGLAEHHNGQDIAAPCGTPIYAATDGVVLKAGPATGFGDAIYLDNGVDLVSGHRIVTWYGHEFPTGIEVAVGQHVTAGQEIGKVGSNGQSTGCHDHFEVHEDGVAVDPVPFMAAHGAPLG